jgi:dihydrofolate reductase
MSIVLIAALAANRVIGRDNQLPWRIPGDLPRFKALTLGQTLVMGRKTFESIGRPLPGRATVVITRNRQFTASGVQIAHDLPSALSLVKTAETFVAGGGEIYAQALPLADALQLTEIDADFPGDAFFPVLDRRAWNVVSDEVRPADDAFPHVVHHRLYRRA